MILTTFDPLYVVDTHALYWYLTGDKKLGHTALQIFYAAQQGQTEILISAIVVAELYFLNRKWNVFPDFAVVYEDLMTSSYFRMVPFDPEEVLNFDKNALVPEMHDRIITGLARVLGVSLITLDPAIVASKLVTTVW